MRFRCPGIGPRIVPGNASSSQSWSSYWAQLTFQSVQPATIAQVSLVLKAEADGELVLNWGDGSGDVTLTADGHDHTYTSNYSTNNTTYDITITGYVYYLKKFLLANNTTVALNISDFKRVGLSYLELDTCTGAITGSLNDLPTTLNYLKLDTIGSLITGSLSGSNLSYLAYLEMINHPLITGNLHQLSQYLIYTILEDCPLVTGTIDNFGPNHRTISLIDLAQTITGTIGNLPLLQLNYLVLDNLGSGIGGNIEDLVVTSDQYIDGLTTCRILPTANTNAFTGNIETFLAANPNLVVANFDFVNLGDNITGSAGTFISNYTPDSADSTLDAVFTLSGASTKTIKLIGRSGKRAVTIDWGEGAVVSLTMDGTEKTISHDYSGAGTFNFVLRNGYNLTRFWTDTNGMTNSVGSINQFAGFQNMTTLRLSPTTTAWTGSINTFASITTLTYLYMVSIGTGITGSIDNLAHISNTLYLSNLGTNLTGSAKNLHTSLGTLTLHILGTTINIATGPHPAWALAAIQFLNNHPSTDIDNFLISWAATAGTGTRTITLTRSRTAASDAAVATLNGKGKTVNTSG